MTIKGAEVIFQTIEVVKKLIILVNLYKLRLTFHLINYA